MLRMLSVEQLKQIVEVAESLNEKSTSAVFDVVDDKNSKRLKEILSTLSFDAAVELKALLWMGRGDCSTYDEAMIKAGLAANPLVGLEPLSDDKSPIPKYLRQAATLLSIRLE